MCVLTSRRRRTASVFPQSAASCNAVPDFVCRFMSMPAWISNLEHTHTHTAQGSHIYCTHSESTSAFVPEAIGIKTKNFSREILTILKILLIKTVRIS